ncbi:MAG: HAD family hydrolase [Tistlia sp.]|uniref:HAD family hydrolase n=1 Tax=Tistlia sp. TaxID=3057121 RepID=UPI0034A47CCE
MPAPKAILFDWDNTLVDTWSVIHHALAVTFEAFGRTPWTLEETRQRVRASARDAFPELFGDDTEAATELFYETFARDHLKGLAPRRGAPETLAALAAREGLWLGVVSNKTGRYLRQEAEHLGWNGHFRQLVGALDAVRDKPARDPVVMALSGSGLEPGPAVWFVGDTDIDMLCARNAGCTGLLIRDEAPAEGEFAEAAPHRHVATFEELLALLE